MMFTRVLTWLHLRHRFCQFADVFGKFVKTCGKRAVDIWYKLRPCIYPKARPPFLPDIKIPFKNYESTQWVIIYHRGNQLSSDGRKAETHMLTLAVFNNVWLYRQLVNTNLYCMKLRPCRRTLKRILSRNISRDVAKLWGWVENCSYSASIHS